MTNSDFATTYTFFETAEEAQVAASELRGMGPAARKLLAECIEHQELSRTAISKAADSLHQAGFIFIRGGDQLFDRTFTLTPSLAGEDALLRLEEEAVAFVPVSKGKRNGKF